MAVRSVWSLSVGGSLSASLLSVACSDAGFPRTPNSTGSPDVEWHVGQGTDGEEHVHEGWQTQDGGYIAIGQVSEGTGSWTDLLVIKVDEVGELEWQRQMGTSGEMDIGITIRELPDGSFVAGGGLSVEGRQMRALMGLTATGAVSWTQTYDHVGNGAVRGLALLESGSIVATGYTDSEEAGFLFIAEEANGFLMQVDASGALAWDQSLSVPQGTKVFGREDGGFWVLSTGWVERDGDDRMVAMIVETDSMGHTLWQQHYGSEGMNQAFDFDQTLDGGAILAGHTTGYDAENWDCWLTRVGEDGRLSWTQIFGQPRGYDAGKIHDECYGVRSLSDGGFVMTGGTGDEYLYSADGHPSGPSDEWKVFLVRTDGDGRLIWQNVYGDGAGAGHNAGEFLDLTSDEGFVVFTDTDVVGESAPNNFGFMKLSAEDGSVSP